MKKIILSESEVVSLIKSIMEQDTQFDFSDIDDLDYYDALFLIFRNWVQKSLPEDERDYPTSYLLEKYGKKFVQELVDDGTLIVDDNFEVNRWTIPRVVQALIKKGHYKFPSKRKNEKFTERFKKHINYYIKEQNLPSWAEVVLVEKTPYIVSMKLNIDFPDMIKDSSNSYVNASSLEREFTKFVENYLGVEIGNPNYGQLRLLREGTNFVHLDGWVKEILNKEIKKQIKQLPYGRHIHSMKFQPNERQSELKIVFKNTAGYNGRSQFRTEVAELLNNLGYKRIRIEY